MDPGRRPDQILDEANLRAVSKALKGVELKYGDFTCALDNIKAGDLLYADPPYWPVSKTANFTTYSRGGFGPEDQRRLRDVFAALSRRGVYVLLSNADCPEIRDLYAGFRIDAVQARRSVNSRGDRRGKVGEVIVISEALADALAVEPPIALASASG